MVKRIVLIGSHFSVAWSIKDNFCDVPISHLIRRLVFLKIKARGQKIQNNGHCTITFFSPTLLQATVQRIVIGLRGVPTSFEPVLGAPQAKEDSYLEESRRSGAETRVILVRRRRQTPKLFGRNFPHWGQRPMLSRVIAEIVQFGISRCSF